MAKEPDYEKEDAELKAGKRVQEFLADEHVRKAIADKKASLARDIFRAGTVEKAIELWNVGKALDLALDSLKATADGAEYVENVRAERDRLALRQRRDPR